MYLLLMTAILIFLGTMILSALAAARVKSTFLKYSQVDAGSGYTGAQAASYILSQAGINNVDIEEGGGFLGDHYDPINRRLVLSSDNYHGKSCAALGIAAHECGHAIQHKAQYAPLNIRMAAVSVTGVASQVLLWLPILGVFTGILGSYTAAWIAASAWGVLMLFNLITLPVEFDASRRAKIILLEARLVHSDRIGGVIKTLDAAAWTYVAAFITTLVYFLLHILPLLNNRK